MKKKKLLAVLLAAALLTSAASGCKKISQPETSTTAVSSELESTVSQPPADPVNLNPLTGVADLPENMIGKRPVSFMINNAKQAWPQCGISQADIVYEWPYEGSATRLMAVFSDWTKASTVGPIRSVRHDFVELSMPLHTLFVHWGGSVPGLQAIVDNEIDDLDGNYGGAAFFRDQARRNQGIALEHTAMADTTKLEEMVEEKQYNTEIKIDKAYNFNKEEAPVTFADAAAVEITAQASADISCTYKYDAATMKYTKYEYDQQQMDANDNSPVELDNIFLLNANIGHYMDDPNVIWRDMHLEDGGTGYYITRGTKTPITWTKETSDSPIKYLLENGEEVTVNPGNSWVMFLEPSFQEQTVFS